VAPRRDKCPHLASHLFCGCRAPTTAILQHIDCSRETLDEILQRSASQTGRKCVCKDQTFAHAEPLEMTSGALCFHWEGVSYELESQNERLERVFTCDGSQPVFAQTRDLNRAPPRITTFRPRRSDRSSESDRYDSGTFLGSCER
jgi:hypothetical protein